MAAKGVNDRQFTRIGWRGFSRMAVKSHRELMSATSATHLHVFGQTIYFLARAKKNMEDMVRKGRGERGIDRWNASLTEADVIAIRDSTEPYPVLAARYGVHKSAIEAARNGSTWKHVKAVAIEGAKERLSHKGESHPGARLTEDNVRVIRQRAASGETHRSLAVEYGVTRPMIGAIVRRVSWRPVL